MSFELENEAEKNLAENRLLSTLGEGPFSSEAAARREQRHDASGRRLAQRFERRRRHRLGTDSAPHSTSAKETSCGCAGCYTSYAAIELYAMAFEAMDSLDKLEGFASHFGPDFYGLPRNEGSITLVQNRWTAPTEFEFGNETLPPLLAGEPIDWRLVE